MGLPSRKLLAFVVLRGFGFSRISVRRKDAGVEKLPSNEGDEIECVKNVGHIRSIGCTSLTIGQERNGRKCWNI